MTQNLDAIKNDLKDISDAQSDLSDDRRSEVEAANKEFTSSVEADRGRRSAARSRPRTRRQGSSSALQQLGASYQKAFAPVNCD